MAGTIGIVITGHEQVIANLNNLGPEAQKLIEQTMKNSANQVASVAKQLAPFRTGYLRANITVDSATATKAQITSHAEYSIYQKDDFMGEALAQEGPKLISAMQKVFPQAWGTSR